MADALRWTTIFMCLFNIGVLVALFEEVGKYFLPKIKMRLLMAANILSLFAIGLASYARLNEPVSWRIPLFLTAALLQLAALIRLHRWYGTEEGQSHKEKMLS